MNYFSESEEEEKSRGDLLVESLQELRKRRQAIDVVLVVRGKEIPAHRAVLIATSSYFEKLFLAGFRETGEARINIDYDPVLVDLVVKYLYGENIYFLPEYRALAMFEWGKTLLFFGVKGYDPMVDIKVRALSETQEEANSFFKKLTDFVNLYPGGIPEDVIDHLASLLIPEGTELVPDLNDYSDDFIMLLLKSPSYRPKNLLHAWDSVKRLIDQGHSRDLLTLFNYDKFPAGLFSPDFLALYNKEGPIPRLGGTGRPILLIAEQPVSMVLTGLFSTKFIDEFGSTWNGVINTKEWDGTVKEPPKLGDIGTAGLQVTHGATGELWKTPQRESYMVTKFIPNGFVITPPFTHPQLYTQTDTIIDLSTIDPNIIPTIFLRAYNWNPKY